MIFPDGQGLVDQGTSVTTTERGIYLELPPRRVGDEQRREHALQAAIDAIVERGYAHARFADVSRLSGIAVSTLQYYFGSREAMLIEAMTVAANQDLAQLWAQVDLTISDAWERVRRLVDYALAINLNDTREWAILLQLAMVSLADDEVREVTRAYDRLWRIPFAEVVRRGVEEGAFTPREDPEFVASWMVSTVDGIWFGVLMGREEVLLERQRQALIEDLRWWLGLTE